MGQGESVKMGKCLIVIICNLIIIYFLLKFIIYSYYLLAVLHGIAIDH